MTQLGTKVKIRTGLFLGSTEFERNEPRASFFHSNSDIVHYKLPGLRLTKMIPGVEAEASGASAALQPTGIQPKRPSLSSLPVLFGLVFTFFVYLPTLSYQFVFDDQLQILSNNHLLSWRYLSDYFT